MREILVCCPALKLCRANADTKQTLDDRHKHTTMRYDKRIITHKWGNNPTRDESTASNGFIIEGFVISGKSYGRTLAFLNELAAEAKRDFPSLTDGQIEPFIVTRSSYNKGFAGIRFPLPANTIKDDYHRSAHLDFEHS